MNKIEVINFIKKIKAYYPTFKLEEESIDEWVSRLKPYDENDVLRKLEEHLNGEMGQEPPKLHFITKYLKTTEQKERMGKDYLIRCDLCGKIMHLSTCENEHYEKCLCITTLMMFLKKEGRNVTYDYLDGFSYEKLDKVLEKYLSKDNRSIDEVLKNVGNCN